MNTNEKLAANMVRQYLEEKIISSNTELGRDILNGIDNDKAGAVQHFMEFFEANPESKPYFEAKYESK